MRLDRLVVASGKNYGKGINASGDYLRRELYFDFYSIIKSHLSLNNSYLFIENLDSLTFEVQQVEYGEIRDMTGIKPDIRVVMRVIYDANLCGAQKIANYDSGQIVSANWFRTDLFVTDAVENANRERAYISVIHEALSVILERVDVDYRNYCKH